MAILHFGTEAAVELPVSVIEKPVVKTVCKYYRREIQRIRERERIAALHRGWMVDDDDYQGDVL